MCVRGKALIKNNTDGMILLHLSGHEGWGFFFVPPHSKREGPVVKFTDEPWFPGRRYKVPGAITDPSGKEIWKGNIPFENFEIVASAHVSVSSDIAGNLKIDVADFEDIQSKIAQDFFGHSGSRNYPTNLPSEFRFEDSEHLEGTGV